MKFTNTPRLGRKSGGMGHPSLVERTKVERWLHKIFLSLAFVLCLLRFAYLRADFPNHSPWMMDQSKFTDEGWWANAAVRHFLIGHWQVAGDYNPAAAVPVWPALLTLVFQFTGVSIVATRAANVFFSIATVGLFYLLVRRYASETAAAVAALLLAASPFAFAFSRLATLDTMVNFEFCLLLWVASFANPRRIWPSILLGTLIPIMLLTKTTAVVLVPAVLWLLWMATKKRFLLATLLVGALAGAGIGIYMSIVLRSRYAEDYHYFFDINALADVEWERTAFLLRQLLRHCMWIDPILYPAALAVLLLSLVWLRQLWRNPLFTASWIAFAGDAVYILRRQDDYAPRYFLAMLVPLILVLVFALQELKIRNRSLASLLAATLALAMVLDTAKVLGFLSHRQYQFSNAAESIKAIVNADPNAHRLLLGSSGDQLSLMTGIPSINDGYSSEDLAQKLSRYQPGWYVGWNELDQDIVSSLTAFRLDKVATYRVFDRDERNLLTLYRMVPAKPSGGS
jgi:4-amino-4-deoxy-L-arabinose transferase-like glycosyltransferase